MTIYTECLKYFIGLMAVINPVGLIPVFAALTDSMEKKERLHVNYMANLSVAVILLVSMFLGQMILNWFSISFDSFRIAGGVLIISVSFSMVQGQLENGRRNPEEKKEAAMRDSIAVVPLAMPLMAGPGAISSTIVFSSQFQTSYLSLAGGVMVILIFSLISFLIFQTSQFVLHAMGKTGVNIVTRIMGIIMMSLGVEMLAKGIKAVFRVNDLITAVEKIAS